MNFVNIVDKKYLKSLDIETLLKIKRQITSENNWSNLSLSEDEKARIFIILLREYVDISILQNKEIV